MTRALRAVAFDLGNVMIYWDPRLLYRKLLPSEEAVERFLATVCTSDWNHRLDAGLPLAEGIAERVERFPEHEALIRAYGERFAEMMLPMSASIALLGELRERGVGCYALSNWNADTFERTRARFPFLERFDGLVISGRVGLAKPDRRIYEHLLEANALAAEEVLFVDDRPTNVEAGRAAGIASLLFEGPTALREALEERGLL
ncbi:MAG: HAD family phosphatase [Myxococcota bacterium]